jgi:hypothetical protein
MFRGYGAEAIQFSFSGGQWPFCHRMMILLIKALLRGKKMIKPF